MISKLLPDQRFVFGSNLKGEHAGGAAAQACQYFGARWGVGEGLTGDCYAFPTLDQNWKQFSRAELLSIRDAFYRCVLAHPELTFLLTKVGTGIAGYAEEDMMVLFANAPENVVKPEGWV